MLRWCPLQNDSRRSVFTFGREEIFFSKKFLSGLLWKNSGGFTGRQNCAIQVVRQMRDHLHLAWERDPPVIRGATAPKFGSNFGSNSSGTQKFRE